MAFSKELEFESALIELLKTKGWANGVLKNPSEEDLIQNWANILLENNKGIDRLNGIPLTKSEMQQIINKINELKTPINLNAFITGGSVTIIRDNPNDALHLGKSVTLKIFDSREIAGGQSRYQIAEQPQFKTANPIMGDRRGDMMLLIYGIPVIHVELKRSGVDISQAVGQIKRYTTEGVFSHGLFSLIQIFVAMNPEEMCYFANPGYEGEFKNTNLFHWADFNNNPIGDWRRIGASFLSIPHAHQMVGLYTIADDGDGLLKVMRSYQFYAANAISDTVSKHHWDEVNQLGGYIWHTTGSGKTMTSFKSAQLIANSKDADKVIFLIDRIELGTQSLSEYRNFAGVGLTEEQKMDTVQATEDTYQLIDKLKSNDPKNILIVTSIQKMSNISEDSMILKTSDLDAINSKRIVFIVDECHRDTFGEMMQVIKVTFKKALFFGFTGTPIQKENIKKDSTTATIFGNELHRYSIADGINDKNVLGFDPYKVLTFKDTDVRKAIALEQAKAKTEIEVFADEKKKETYLYYMNDAPMAGYWADNGEYVKGIEDYLKPVQYTTEEHQNAVVNDILDNWVSVSQAGMFHAIFATNSISEALDYYRLLKSHKTDLKITALFDPSIDNNDKGIKKEEALVEIVTDYDDLYNQSLNISEFYKMKRDISQRLAHKGAYRGIENRKEEQIDLLIVVDQMLTGFDSKWINALYLDKILRYENIIQAFSRTNRVFGKEKQFGIIKYYRKPHTMEKNIENAVKAYSGDKPFALFVDKLPKNLRKMNQVYDDIEYLFDNAGIENFEKNSDDKSEQKQFILLFILLNNYIESAKVQGFYWGKLTYVFNADTDDEEVIDLNFDYYVYQILRQRYRELMRRGPVGPPKEFIPYDLDGYVNNIQTGKIDADYMNSRFEKYLKTLKIEGVSEQEIKSVEDELHKTFALLSQEEQKYANIFLHDIQNGDAVIVEGKPFRDYVTEYMNNARNDRIHRFADEVGINEEMLRNIMNKGVTMANLNDFGRYDMLKESASFERIKEYIEGVEGKSLPTPLINIKFDKLLREFILNGENDV